MLSKRITRSWTTTSNSDSDRRSAPQKCGALFLFRSSEAIANAGRQGLNVTRRIVIAGTPRSSSLYAARVLLPRVATTTCGIVVVASTRLVFGSMTSIRVWYSRSVRGPQESDASFAAVGFTSRQAVRQVGAAIQPYTQRRFSVAATAFMRGAGSPRPPRLGFETSLNQSGLRSKLVTRSPDSDQPVNWYRLKLEVQTTPPAGALTARNSSSSWPR